MVCWSVDGTKYQNLPGGGLHCLGFSLSWIKSHFLDFERLYPEGLIVLSGFSLLEIECSKTEFIKSFDIGVVMKINHLKGQVV